MPEQLEPEAVLREINDLETRIGELRQAAAVPEPDLRATLQAALLELDAALASLRVLGGGPAGDEGNGPGVEAERRVLRTVFQDAPVPLFLLDSGGDIRRVNRQAALLLGTSPGYAAGRPFPVFCDLSNRAAVRSQLAAVVRTGERHSSTVRFLGGDRPIEAEVTLALIQISGEADPMVVAAAAPLSGRIPQPPAPAVAAAEDAAVAAVLHRMDLLASSTELLLDEPLFNEPVALRRCARLLASELADWVIIDLATPENGGGESGDLRRQVVFGPSEERLTELTRVVENLDPRPEHLPHTVFTTRQPRLHSYVEDLDLLGVTEGVGVCSLLGATSVLSVPIEDGEHCHGTITLAASGEHGHFDLTDLGVVQRLARHLALVIRAARMYRRSAEVAQTLQAGLLPRKLPEVPGMDIAARYLAATRGVDVGGDFYDVFPAVHGWGFVLGDVCGKGEEAAAVTATARHGVRLLARWKEDPGEVLSMVSQTLLDEERFVTAVLAWISDEGKLQATLGTAGHPPAILVRADGTIRTTGGGGVPLGLFEDFEPGVETFDLSEGDTLFLHSDGVLDACDLIRERFGDERLIEVLAAHSAAPVGEMLAAVERTLLDFCGGDLDDDISMLALRVLPQTLN
jgi:PAS domain S-box-containing protein